MSSREMYSGDFWEEEMIIQDWKTGWRLMRLMFFESNANLKSRRHLRDINVKANKLHFLFKNIFELFQIQEQTQKCDCKTESHDTFTQRPES